MLLNYLKALKYPILIFFVSIFIAITVVLISVQYWDEAILENTQAKQRLESAKFKYKQAIDRQLIFKEYESRYNALLKRNIAGIENRIDWINLIELIAKNNKIPFVNYKIDKQVKSSNNDISRKYPGLDMYRSDMTLDMKILHEGDLYTIINELRLNAKGLFDVSSCDIKRIKHKFRHIVDNKTGINFSVKCKLSWYSFQPKSA